MMCSARVVDLTRGKEACDLSALTDRLDKKMRKDDSKPARLLMLWKQSTAPLYTNDQLITKVWGEGADIEENTLHKTMERARAYGAETGLGTIQRVTAWVWNPESTCPERHDKPAEQPVAPSTVPKST
jgi:hypothetical protein